MVCGIARRTFAPSPAWGRVILTSRAGSRALPSFTCLECVALAVARVIAGRTPMPCKAAPSQLSVLHSTLGMERIVAVGHRFRDSHCKRAFRGRPGRCADHASRPPHVVPSRGHHAPAIGRCRSFRQCNPSGWLTLPAVRTSHRPADGPAPFLRPARHECRTTKSPTKVSSASLRFAEAKPWDMPCPLEHFAPLGCEHSKVALSIRETRAEQVFAGIDTEHPAFVRRRATRVGRLEQLSAGHSLARDHASAAVTSE